jgi:hypothetical protein
MLGYGAVEPVCEETFQRKVLEIIRARNQLTAGGYAECLPTGHKFNNIFDKS